MDELVKTDLLVDLAHALGIGLSGTDGAEDDVHLLEGKTLGLWNEEPDEEGADEGEDAEEDIGAVGHAGEHVGGDLTDYEVVHPVGRGSESDAVWTAGNWPDLCDDDPGTWSPRVSETGNEDPDHGDGGPARTNVCRPVALVSGYEDGNDEVAEGHDPSTTDQDWLTAKLVDVHDSGDGEDEHNDTDDTSSKERDGIGAKSEGLEDLRSVVEDSIDTGPLLEEHGKASAFVRL